MAKTILGIFPDKIKADKAVDGLLHYGYRNDEVSVISKDGDRFEYEHPGGQIIGSNTLLGFATGFVVGAVIGAAAGFAAFYIPGATSMAESVGLTGVTGTMILGAVAGAIVGSILGLLASGKDEYKGMTYENMEQYGQVLVAVPASNDEEIEVKDMLREYGAISFQTIDLSEYVESEYRTRFEPMNLAGFKGGRRSERERLGDE